MVTLRLLNGLLMVVLPIGLAAYFISKFKSDWRLWWIGGAVFVLSQVGHIPFNYYSSLFLNKTNLVNWSLISRSIFNAFFLGLSAGLWEEGARYVAFRWWVGKAKSWSKGIQLGVGHGGFESMILGLLVLYTIIQMVVVKNMDISALIPADQLPTTTRSIAAYWAMPWYDVLLGFIERVLTLPIQIALSVIMLQIFIRKKIIWIWVAILFHTIVDATAVLFMTFSNIYFTEMAVAFFSAISIGIIIFLKSPDPVEEEPEGERLFLEKFDNKICRIQKVDESLENLDATRYQ